MAQHPRKLEWRERISYGLSASQFGMALGLCGRVIDYVNYVRNIVGTEMEFVGNEFTNHGIVTEDKSRSLYEMLTGSLVLDGGFFVTDDYVLGCSPDGRIVLCDCDPQVVLSASSKQRRMCSQGSRSSQPKNSLNSTQESPVSPSSSSSPLSSQRSIENVSPRNSSSGSSSDAQCSQQSRRCSISVPFRKKSAVLTTPPAAQAQLNGVLDTAAEKIEVPVNVCTECRHPVRLLEIKSPFRALYDGSKRGYEPFGIPQHYMCQMQGQMSIAGADECDFFVFLDGPTTEVAAWRVRRSTAFWDWAVPKLRQVSAWVRDGPPEWLNRSFEFEAFDYGTLEVVPLVFPFNISLGIPLRDSKRFSFFETYLDPSKSEARNRGAAAGSFGKQGNGFPANNGKSGGGHHGQRTFLFGAASKVNRGTASPTSSSTAPHSSSMTAIGRIEDRDASIRRSFDEAESLVCRWNGIENIVDGMNNNNNNNNNSNDENDNDSNGNILDGESACYKDGRLTARVVREHREMYERLNIKSYTLFCAHEPRLDRQRILRNIMEGLMHPMTRSLFSHPSFARLAMLGLSSRSENSDVIEAAEPVDPNSGSALVIEVRFKDSSQVWETSCMGVEGDTMGSNEKLPLLKLIAANYTRGTVRFSSIDSKSNKTIIFFYERDTLCKMMPKQWNPKPMQENNIKSSAVVNSEHATVDERASLQSEMFPSNEDSSAKFRVVSPSKWKAEQQKDNDTEDAEKHHATPQEAPRIAFDPFAPSKELCESVQLSKVKSHDNGTCEVVNSDVIRDEETTPEISNHATHEVLVEQTPPSPPHTSPLSRQQDKQPGEIYPPKYSVKPRLQHDTRPVVILVDDSRSPSLQCSSRSRSVSPQPLKAQSNYDHQSASSSRNNGTKRAAAAEDPSKKNTNKKRRSEVDVPQEPEYMTISSSRSVSRQSISPSTNQERDDDHPATRYAGETESSNGTVSTVSLKRGKNINCTSDGHGAERNSTGDVKNGSGLEGTQDGDSSHPPTNSSNTVSSNEEVITQVPFIDVEDIVSLMHGKTGSHLPLPPVPHVCCGVVLLPALNAPPQFFLNDSADTRSSSSAVPSFNRVSSKTHRESDAMLQHNKRRVLLLVSRGATLEYLLYQKQMDPFNLGDNNEEDGTCDRNGNSLGINRTCSEDFPAILPSSMRDVARTLRYNLQDVLGCNSNDSFPQDLSKPTSNIRFSTLIRFFDHILFCLVESPNQRSVRLGPSQCSTVVLLAQWEDVVKAVVEQQSAGETHEKDSSHQETALWISHPTST